MTIMSDMCIEIHLSQQLWKWNLPPNPVGKVLPTPLHKKKNPTTNNNKKPPSPQKNNTQNQNSKVQTSILLYINQECLQETKICASSEFQVAAFGFSQENLFLGESLRKI